MHWDSSEDYRKTMAGNRAFVTASNALGVETLQKLNASIKTRFMLG